MEDETLKDMYLTFPLGKESYGIEVGYVREIIGVQPITKVPGLPEYIKGIINLRGSIIPVMDIRLRFKKEPIEYSSHTCIVIIEIDNMSVGLIVDGVSEVMTIEKQNIIDPPSLGKGYSNKYIKEIGKVGDQVRLLLNCEKLLEA